MKRVALYVLGLGLCFGYVVSCQKDSSPGPVNSGPKQAALNSDTSQPVIMREPELSTFASLIQAANLVNFFHGTGPFTSFVPSNAAFEKLDKTKLADLKDPKNMDELIDLINYHVILGKYLSQNLKSCTKRTVNGKNITIRVENDQIWVNGAKVTKKDLVGPNGVTYVIDTVLVP